MKKGETIGELRKKANESLDVKESNQDSSSTLLFLKTRKRKRIFLGEMPTNENSTENKFRKAHLKAYLKGRSTFNFGFYPRNGYYEPVPMKHNVQQKFI